MSEASELDRGLDALAGLIARARADLDADRLIDVSALEPRVDELCTRLAALPAGKGETFRARLQALIDDLGHLAGEIERRLAELKGALGGAGDRHRALGAYGKGAGAPGPETER